MMEIQYNEEKTEGEVGQYWVDTTWDDSKTKGKEVIKRCLPGLGHIHHYRGATGGVPYPRVDIRKFSNIILL